MKKLFVLNKPERKYLYLGILAAAVNGAINPIVGLFLSYLTVVLLETDSKNFRDDSNMYCLAFLIIAIVSFLANLL